MTFHDPYELGEHLHRLAKLALDSGEVSSVEKALELFSNYSIHIHAGTSVGKSPAQQAALLTAVNSARRALLGSITISGLGDAPLLVPIAKASSFAGVLAQIMLLDIVFSLDSVITAVGMAQHVGVMIAAIIIAVLVMMIFASAVSAFISRHPTLKVLALSFLILIGVMLVAEGLHQHVSKGYIYFAMAFSLLVETLNIRMQTKARART